MYYFADNSTLVPHSGQNSFPDSSSAPQAMQNCDLDLSLIYLERREDRLVILDFAFGPKIIPAIIPPVIHMTNPTVSPEYPNILKPRKMPAKNINVAIPFQADKKRVLNSTMK